MTTIKPFKALVYNQTKTAHLDDVVCPPYDVISAAEQKKYHERNPYNFIHILFGLDLPGDDKYKRASKYFSEWQKNDVLIQDSKPAFYFYLQQYHVKGEKKIRYGFIGLLHLGKKGSGVYVHENTRVAPKEDRAKIIRSVKANLSPIFVAFPDHKRVIQRLSESMIGKVKPFIELTDNDKVLHKVWRIDDPAEIEKIQSRMLDENMFIADGHHRFEVACGYRDEMSEKLGSAYTGEEDFNYILTYFTNTDSRGLTIFPIHRLLKLDAHFQTQAFIKSISEYFDVEDMKDKNRFFFLMDKGGRTEHVLGLYRDKTYWLLRLKNVKILDKLISDKPKEYRSLDVSILNYLIFKNTLKLEPDDTDRILYTHDSDEAEKLVDEKEYSMAFFLNPVRMEQIMAVALRGEKMPPKSTYFYPKVLSGLVINKHNE